MAPLIEAEIERRYPERRKLFGTTPEALRDALPVVEELLERTWKRAKGSGRRGCTSAWTRSGR